MIRRPRIALKYRIKRVLERPISRFFFWLVRRKSHLLTIGFIEKMRRRFAPTHEEIRQEIIQENKGSLTGTIRRLLEFESFSRKIMPPDELPLD